MTWKSHGIAGCLCGEYHQTMNPLYKEIIEITYYCVENIVVWRFHYIALLRAKQAVNQVTSSRLTYVISAVFHHVAVF